MTGCIFKLPDGRCDKLGKYMAFCIGEACEHQTPTNGDRIRAMSDEELDKFLGEVQWDVANYCGGVTQKQEYPVPEQRGAWLDWLKAPAEKEDEG